MKILINGFGRIGRAILRQILTSPRGENVEVFGINDIAEPEMCGYLFQYDSTFGPYPGTVNIDNGALVVDGWRFPLFQTRDITELDLAGVDVVLECTGIARTSDVASRGLKAGAKRVLISGPSPAAEKTIVFGANDASLGSES
ncbi:MAG: glyceraldehyde 3-phosphate dehydrogenase N-terminal domain-containing protein, partial [Epibacterium sp.]|nr:glyceraldehyde 3-phosphate dehydrogenase N-terminal domain-containing protein [Epibacterium sp.]NQX74963.1 glyceraldehyde-3-phosphate dehydrogenase [Epibacterium sp.]